MRDLAWIWPVGPNVCVHGPRFTQYKWGVHLPNSKVCLVPYVWDIVPYMWDIVPYVWDLVPYVYDIVPYV